MMAASAMCMHFHASDDEYALGHFRATAEYHGDRALRDCRAEMLDIRPSNVDTMMACSRILALLGIIFFRSHRADGLTLADAESCKYTESKFQHPNC